MTTADYSHANSNAKGLRQREGCGGSERSKNNSLFNEMDSDPNPPFQPEVIIRLKNATSTSKALKDGSIMFRALFVREDKQNE
jgi:hypothetical protein